MTNQFENAKIKTVKEQQTKTTKRKGEKKMVKYFVEYKIAGENQVRKNFFADFAIFKMVLESIERHGDQLITYGQERVKN